MAIRTYKVTLDSKNSIAPEPVFLRQGDKTGAVVIDATLMDNGAPVSLDGLTPMFKANTADGQAVIADSTGFNIINDSGGEFTYQVPSQLGSVYGKIHIAYFSFSDSTGAQSTFNVVFVVEKAADMTQESAKDWISTLEEIIEQYNQWSNDAHNSWEQFVNDNKEIIKSIDPGGKVLSELIDFRHSDMLSKTFDTAKLRGDFFDQEFADRGVNVKWFGAKGDGKSDDTEAIQAAIDYLFNNHLFGSVVFPAGVYNVSRPILLKSTQLINNSWWKGSGITLAGYGKASTIISKITGECLTGIGDGVDGIDATVIAVKFSNGDSPSYVPLGTSTGSGIKDMTLQNSKAHMCFGLYGPAFQRGNISGVNIESYSGISLQDPFTNIFTDVEINAIEDGFVIDRGTSNTFTNVHVHYCKNPIQINSAYSTMQNCFTEKCTGTLWKIGGPSLVLSGCGDESPHAQWTVEPQQGFITINGYYHIAPEGDSSTNLLTNQCGFVHTVNSSSAVSIRDLYVRFFDTETINGNGQSYLFYHDDVNKSTNYNIENIFYATDNGNVQLLGGISPSLVDQKDVPFIFSNGLSHGTDLGHLQLRGTDVNLLRGHYMPYLGSRDVNGSVQAGFKNKAIYLDMENTHQTSTLDASGKPSDIQNLPAFNQGDLLMFNDPNKQAAMGAIVNNQPAKGQNQAYNKFSMVPLIMYGTTAQRPGTTAANTPAEGLTPGTMYYDWTVGKPIWWHGTWWADAMGNQV